MSRYFNKMMERMTRKAAGVADPPTSDDPEDVILCPSCLICKKPSAFLMSSTTEAFYWQIVPEKGQVVPCCDSCIRETQIWAFELSGEAEFSTAYLCGLQPTDPLPTLPEGTTIWTSSLFAGFLFRRDVPFLLSFQQFDLAFSVWH